MLRDLRARSRSRAACPAIVEGLAADDARDHRRRHRPSHRVTPALEALEGRRLLSGYSGPSRNRPVVTRSGVYMIQVAGPGAVEVRQAGRGMINVEAYGTSASSTITISEIAPRYHATATPLLIRNLTIRSGQLGGLNASAAELDGRVTPLAGSLNLLEIGTIGPAAQVTIGGSVAAMVVSAVDLGPTGRFVIQGDVNTITQPGLSTLLPLIQTAGSTTSNTTNTIGSVPIDVLQSGLMSIGSIAIDGGRFVIGRDSLASIAINSDLVISHDGVFSIGRDQAGTFTVDGSVRLDSGGQLLIGRNLGSLSVTGNIIVQPGGGGIAVDGALQSLTVDGYFQGQGGASNPSAIDLGVGLNLSSLIIQGGVSGQGGLINANVRAGGSVSGVNIPYGVSNSTIVGNTTMAT